MTILACDRQRERKEPNRLNDQSQERGTTWWLSKEREEG
jgi:hypothetical protein